MLYIFDFCGTIINRKTHSMIKWYCLLNGHFLFFCKYVNRRKDIEFDIAYINKYIDIKKLALFIFRWSKPTKVFIENKVLLQNCNTCYILTAAMDEVVKEILVLYGVLLPSQMILGSNSSRVIDGKVKREIVENIRKNYNAKYVVFFTDSWDDQPVFEVSDKVIFSEFLDDKCKSLLSKDSKYTGVI